MRLITSVVATLGLVAISPTIATGAALTFSFAAQVNGVTDPQDIFGGTIQVNDIISGTYTFDSLAVDRDARPIVGDWAVTMGSLQMGNQSFTSNSPQSHLFVFNDAGGPPVYDAYNFALYAGTSNLREIDFTLADLSSTVFSNDQLPLVPPDLQAFDGAFGTFRYFAPDNQTVLSSVNLRMTSLSAIPEPSGAVLAALGLAGLICWRWRQYRCIRRAMLARVNCGLPFLESKLMNKLTAVFLFAAIAVHSGDACAITIPTIRVGNPGNSPDIRTITPESPNGYGAVPDVFNIGKYEVTVGQYTAFLNAVAATDTYALYNTQMTSTVSVAGILRSGVSGSYTYSVIGSPNHPVTYVTWGDAARFTNWLNNGQPYGVEGPGTTETGAYTMNGAHDGDNAALNAITRNAGAQWFIPTENEWYKAAYYEPDTNTYHSYPTSSDAPPTSAPPGGTPNTANFYSLSTGWALTGTTSFDPAQNYLTDVGAYTGTTSPYGAFDMGGNVAELNDTVFDANHRGARGGSFGNIDALTLSFGYRSASPAGGESSTIGFRVASVPEPSTLFLSICGLTGLVAWGWRRKRSHA